MLQINSIKDLDQIIEAHERMMLATYFDLKAERSDFDECDVTGEVLTGDKIATVIIDGVPEPVEITNERY